MGIFNLKSPTKFCNFAGPDTGRTLLVRHRTKNKTTKMVVYISGGEITHKNIFLWGPINHPQNFAILRGPMLVGFFLVRPWPNKKHAKRRAFYFWWPWSDSNRHSLQNLILSQARLPIPPRGLKRQRNKLFCCRFAGFNLFHQTGTAIRFVCRFLCRFFRFPDFFVNSLFNRRHFRCQTGR